MSDSSIKSSAKSSRREFIKGSVAVSGGLLIAISLDGCSEKPAVVISAPGAPSIQQNAWLSIATDGQITFYSGQSEMGQGVYTSLPTLLSPT